MRFDRNSLAALVLVGSALAMAAVVRAQNDNPPASQPVADLGEEMKDMNRSLKIIRRQVTDPSKNASTLKAVADLEQHTLAAKSIAPHSVTTMPTAEENQQKLGDYQIAMLNVLRHELDLEEQLRANQNDKAAQTVESLRGLESDGHRDFRPREN